MARQLVRLKVTLLRNSLAASRRQRLGLAFGVLAALPPAVLAFSILARAGRSPEHGETVAVVAFTLFFLGWIVVPILSFASDETLDPARLALLPLRRTELVRGLFAASLVGLGPLATIVALSGAAVGFARAGPGLVLVVGAVLVQLALCVVGSRAATTALSNVLRSRRGRDVVAVAGALLALALALGAQALVHGERLGLDGLRELNPGPVLSVLGWLPPGLAARSLAAAQADELVRAAWQLALSAAAVAGLAAVWSAALGRALTTAASAGRRARRRGDLFPRAAAFLPRDRRGAVAAKEVRTWLRDPRLRASSLTLAGLALAAVVVVALVEELRRPAAVFVPTALLFFGATQPLNAFGLDGPAYWLNAVASGRARDDLVGKNIGAALVLLPLVAGVAAVLAALTGGWVYLPAAVGAAAGALGAVLAVGNVVSVRLPQPLSESSTNLWGSSGAGTAWASVFARALSLLVVNALAGPAVVALAVGAVIGPVALLAATGLALAYGAGLWRVGVLVAAEWLEGREPELLATLTLERA